MTLEMSCVHNQNQRRTITEGRITCLIEVVEVWRLDFECSNSNVVPAYGRQLEDA